MRSILVRNTLYKMTLAWALILSLVVWACYGMIIKQFEQQVIEQLRTYIIERGEKESLLFQQIQENHAEFAQEYQSRYRSFKTAPKERFDELFRDWGDGTLRLSRAEFEGLEKANGQTSKGMGGFIGQKVEVTDDLRRRLVIGYDMLSTYGVAWHSSTQHYYISAAENATVTHWPELPWTLDMIESDYDMTKDVWVSSGYKANNPMRKSVWTGLYYDAVAKDWMVSCITPIDDQSKHLVSIGNDVMLTKLFDKTVQSNFHGAYNIIFSADGRLIVHPHYMEKIKNKLGEFRIQDAQDKGLESVYQLAQASQENNRIEENQQGDQFIAITKLNGPDWYFVTLFPKSELAQDAREIIMAVVAVGLVLFILVVLVSSQLLEKQMAFPLSQFLDATQKLTDQNFDLVASANLPVDREDEIGTLARAFESMADQLRWSLVNLEDAVMQRTAQLASANETKDKFFNLISHDLRSPIGSLAVLFSDIFERGSDIDDATFSDIRSTIKTTNQLLDNLLFWSRSQKGDIEFVPQHFTMSSIIPNCLDLYQEAANQKGIELSSEFPPDLSVYADLDMTRTILRNLINNAVKFTSQGDKIKVSARPQEGMVKFEVSDTGVGMNPKIKESIFRLDQKVDSSLGTSRESGSGLGLILCAEFVEKSTGKIGLESELGKGSRFWFTLPMGDQAQGSALLDIKTALGLLGTKRILLVEDNPLHRQTGSSVLTELNLNFMVANNGLEALQRFKAEPFDIVLTDIDMPEMNGIEANQAIRQLTSSPPLIIALTSYSKQELGKLAEHVPFDGFLNKPLEREQLLTILQPYLIKMGCPPA